VQRRCDTAAVEQEDGLAAAFGDRTKLGEQRRRERIPRLATKVDDTHRRQWAGEPATELDALELPPALGTRRRAAEHRHGAFEHCALRRHRSRVVARIRFLFVGRVVFLVDADHAEARNGREHSRPCADDDRRFAARDADTLVATLGLRQGRVQNRDAITEAGAEAPERLRSERDLRHEDDCAPSAFEGGRTGLEVDLRLAAAGDAVQQEGRCLPGVERADDPCERRLL